MDDVVQIYGENIWSMFDDNNVICMNKLFKKN